jgi:DNA-binding transcriptional MerR regulator
MELPTTSVDCCALRSRRANSPHRPASRPVVVWTDRYAQDAPQVVGAKSTIATGRTGMASRLLTLPKVAEFIGVEYRTLHTWLKRGLLRPSAKASTGTGHPNLFCTDDLVHAKVIADLRQSGISFDRLEEAADYLDGNEKALRTGAIVIVNGRVSVVDATEAADAIRQEGLTLVYNTEHAVRSMRLLAATV